MAFNQALPLIKNGNFEIVGQRIYAILKHEIALQYQLAQAEEYEAQKYNCEVLYEVKRPWDTLDANKGRIVIWSDRSEDKAEQHTGKNFVTYNIDIYTCADREGDTTGVTVASLKMNRLIHLVNMILKSPKYQHLNIEGEEPDEIVGERLFPGWHKMTPGKDQGAENLVFARVLIDVNVNEEFPEPIADVPLDVELTVNENSI